MQVELALSGLDRHEATIDIPNYLIKIATPLTNLFNESIESGIVPDVFKISKVTPVFKIGAVTDLSNYCPTDVLSPFAKILERLVYNQLNHFLEKENFVFKHQFGFRKNYSTEQAILELTENLKMKIDSNQAVNKVFFLTYLKPLILSTIRSYYRNYTDTESVVFYSNGLKAILKAEHYMLKLRMLNQTHFLSNVVYHSILLYQFSTGRK